MPLHQFLPIPRHSHGQSAKRSAGHGASVRWDKWDLDEVFIRIQGVQHYLWRAVDQDGVVLDILVQGRRDAKSAKRFFQTAAERAAICAAGDRD